MGMTDDGFGDVHVHRVSVGGGGGGGSFPPSPEPFGYSPEPHQEFSSPFEMPEANGGADHDAIFSDGPTLPPPGEMQPEEGFLLREWRRQVVRACKPSGPVPLVCNRLSTGRARLTRVWGVTRGHLSILQTMSTPRVTGGDVGRRVVVGKFLEHAVDVGKLSLKGKKLVELGSRCGLVGCIAAVLGGDAILTYLLDRLKLLRRNAGN